MIMKPALQFRILCDGEMVFQVRNLDQDARQKLAAVLAAVQDIFDVGWVDHVEGQPEAGLYVCCSSPCEDLLKALALNFDLLDVK